MEEVKDPIHVCVGIPYYMHIEPETINCVHALAEYLPQFKFHLQKNKGSCLPIVRNGLFDSVKPTDKLFLGMDGDIYFTPDEFLKLYNNMIEYELNIIFGAYEHKFNETSFVGGMFTDKAEGDVDLDQQTPNKDQGCIPVDWAGTGLFLMYTSLIPELQGGYFSSPRIQVGDNAWKTVPEDVGFCMLLRKKKISFLLDTSLKIYHINRSDELHIKEKEDKIRIVLPKKFIPQLIKSLGTLPFNDVAQTIKDIHTQISIQQSVETSKI